MFRLFILFFLLNIIFQSDNVYAEDAKLSLTDGIMVSKDSSELKDETKEALERQMIENEALENEEDKKGLFSFLNFSFFGKKDNKAVQPQETETQEDYIIRITRLADEGDVNAMLTLGYMYLYGLNGVDMNYKNAFIYYKRAAEKGNIVAVNNLASMYYGGVGIKKNIEKAAELFAIASDAGSIEASLNLAVIYLTHPGHLRNEQAAILLLKKTAEHNNPTGRYLLGYAYLKGIGVPINRKKAVENIRFAADKEYDEAQYILGYLYEYGWGVTQNYNNAIKYMSKAVAQGNVSAISELGRLYAAGDRIENNYYQAYILYILGAYYGIPEADKKRDLLAERGLKKPEVLQAQAEAENYKPQPSELTKYIRTTFGDSLALYIDPKAPIIKIDED